MQRTNKVRAFRRMTETKAFRSWHRLTTARLLGEKTPEQRVEEDMHPRHLKIEGRDASGRWLDMPTGS